MDTCIPFSIKKNTFFLFIKSNIDVLENSKPYDFIFIPKIPIRLCDGDWGLTLLSLLDTGKTKKDNSTSVIYVLCDLCEDSYIEGSFKPLLRKFSIKQHTDDYVNYEDYATQWCVPIRPTKEIHCIHLALYKENLTGTAAFLKGPVICSLRFDKFQ